MDTLVSVLYLLLITKLKQLPKRLTNVSPSFFFPLQCKRFAPIYSAVYNALREQVNVTRVDGEEHRVLRLRFRVDGFPAFFLIHAGKVWRFNGPRSFEDIMLFAHSKGETHGDRLTMIGGPLSPYWSIVGKLFILADHMRTFALAYKDRPLTLLALIFGIIIFSLLLMAGLIYITTKPPAFRHPPQHAHTE